MDQYETDDFHSASEGEASPVEEKVAAVSPKDSSPIQEEAEATIPLKHEEKEPIKKEPSPVNSFGSGSGGNGKKQLREKKRSVPTGTTNTNESSSGAVVDVSGLADSTSAWFNWGSSIVKSIGTFSSKEESSSFKFN